MSKVTLGARPQSFKRNVTVPLPDGSGVIAATYKYRTRREYGAFRDALVEKAKARTAEMNTPEAAYLAPVTWAGVQEIGVSSTAEYLVAILEAWDIAEPFSFEAAAQLADELPVVAQALIDDYAVAITEGRLGN